jgi:hypothetical protein
MKCNSHEELEMRLFDILAKVTQLMEYPAVACTDAVLIPTKDLQYVVDELAALHQDFVSVDISPLIEQIKDSLRSLSNA